MKKGFTLAELMAVVVILGAISLIAIPIILNQVRKAKRDSFDAQIDMIVAGATNYITTKVTDANSEVAKLLPGNSYMVDLNTLQGDGYLDFNIVNPLCSGDDKFFDPLKVKVKITYNGRDYDKEMYYIGAGEEDLIENSCTPSIEIEGA
jgi:prepilin-type N-terminal cleavage/methylation domain-containing protein